MRPCATPGCTALVKRGKCERCKKKSRKAPTGQRAPWYERARRWYNSARWRYDWQPRLLREQPLCVLCKSQGKITPSEVADHKQPHRGVYELFWNWENLQGACIPCHNAKSRSEMDHGG